MILGIGTAFAYQIDSLASGTEVNVPPTQVFVNPGGVGDVLLYGYYNVRGYEHYFTVTNTDTANGVRVRIRFREAATLTGTNICNGSYEVLDFDICLSPGDMWGGVIYTDDNGYARLESWDTDTYVKLGSGDYIFPVKYPNGLEFSTNLGNTADQTREGYFEIIAEQALQEVSSNGDCGPNLLSTNEDAGNVLMGHSYIISPETGASFAYNAVALGDFALADITSGITTNQPNLRDDSEDLTINPVNYALTKRYLATIYDVEPGARTSLIVTFPTKWATHTCTANDDIFDDPRVLITVWDDQENSPTTTCETSPCAPGTDNKLPHEVNVIDINNGGIFTSDVETVIATPYDFGWIAIDLAAANTSNPSPAHVTLYGGMFSVGLPAIGYVVHDFDNGASTGMLPLQYSSDVFPMP